jgi:hypothetical protein
MNATNNKIWTDEDINNLVDECLNDLCKKVQERINQPYGDWAGLYFSDGIMRGNIDDYIRYEMDHAKTPTDKGFKAFQATRAFFPDGSKVEAIECDYATNPVLVYDGYYFIEILKDGNYYLTLENCQYEGKDLETIERNLYSWWIKQQP